MYPASVHANGRYFADAVGDPVFWLGTTQWELVRAFSVEQARLILAKSSAAGFNLVNVMLLGVGEGTHANVHGQTPCHDNDASRPNEAYFEHVDATMQLAEASGLAIALAVYHQRWRELIPVEKARPWARWVAQRYGRYPNIVWSMNPRAQQEYVPVIRELAAGLREADPGRHMITIKPDPSPFSSSFMHQESWLDFNSIQTWRDVDLIYPMVSKDYHLSPAKPVVMGEGAYEGGSEYGFEVTPLWVRRQAYYSYLSGAVHSYGHNDSWRVLATWPQALDAPGAWQLGLLKEIFTARDQWWQLVPDQDLLAEGGCTQGRLLNLAARHRDGRWAMIYLSSPTAFSVRMQKLAGPTEAYWIDPRTAASEPAGRHNNAATVSLQTPPGWEDALLILEAK